MKAPQFTRGQLAARFIETALSKADPKGYAAFKLTAAFRPITNSRKLANGQRAWQGLDNAIYEAKYHAPADAEQAKAFEALRTDREMKAAIGGRKL